MPVLEVCLNICRGWTVPWRNKMYLYCFWMHSTQTFWLTIHPSLHHETVCQWILIDVFQSNALGGCIPGIQYAQYTLVLLSLRLAPSRLEEACYEVRLAWGFGRLMAWWWGVAGACMWFLWPCLACVWGDLKGAVKQATEVVLLWLCLLSPGSRLWGAFGSFTGFCAPAPCLDSFSHGERPHRGLHLLCFLLPFPPLRSPLRSVLAWAAS